MPNPPSDNPTDEADIFDGFDPTRDTFPDLGDDSDSGSDPDSGSDSGSGVDEDEDDWSSISSSSGAPSVAALERHLDNTTIPKGSSPPIPVPALSVGSHDDNALREQAMYSPKLTAGGLMGTSDTSQSEFICGSVASIRGKKYNPKGYS